MIGPVGEINLVLWELLLGNEDVSPSASKKNRGRNQTSKDVGGAGERNVHRSLGDQGKTASAATFFQLF